MSSPLTLNNPPQLTRLGNRSLKGFGQQPVIIGPSAFAQDQVWSARWLIVRGLELAVWKADDEIAVTHLDIEVR